jgi:hypothetical protein
MIRWLWMPCLVLLSCCTTSSDRKFADVIEIADCAGDEECVSWLTAFSRQISPLPGPRPPRNERSILVYLFDFERSGYRMFGLQLKDCKGTTLSKSWAQKPDEIEYRSVRLASAECRLFERLFDSKYAEESLPGVAVSHPVVMLAKKCDNSKGRTGCSINTYRNRSSDIAELMDSVPD